MNPWTNLVIPLLVICGGMFLLKMLLDAAKWGDQEDEKQRQERAEKMWSDWEWEIAALQWDEMVRQLPETDEPAVKNG